MLAIAILVFFMGGTAWLMHKTIDSELEANHRKQFAQPSERNTTNWIDAGYGEAGYTTGGGAAAGATAAASAAIPTAAAAVIREHTSKD